MGRILGVHSPYVVVLNILDGQGGVFVISLLNVVRVYMAIRNTQARVCRLISERYRSPPELTILRHSTELIHHENTSARHTKIWPAFAVHLSTNLAHPPIHT